MAAKIQLLFALCLSVLVAAALAGPLADTANDDENCKASANINKLFDLMLPAIKNLILKHNLDPMKLEDLAENLGGTIVKKRSLCLTDGSLQGLSEVKRARDVILSFDNKILTIDATLGFDLLDLNYEYLFKDWLITRKGHLEGSLRNAEIRVVLGLDMNNYKLILSSLQIVKIGEFNLKLKGHILDPILNAAIKAYVTIFRKKVTSMVEKEATKVLQIYVDEINENIPKPDSFFEYRPDVIGYVPTTFEFVLV